MTQSGKHSSPLRLCLYSLIFVVSVLGSSLGLGAAQFRASVVKIDITPDQPQWLLGYAPRQSTGVHDHLFHRIVAMDDGATQFYLISTDICLYSPSVYDSVTSEIEKQTGIKPLQIWWTVTHTHSAPEVGPPGLGSVFLVGRYEHDHNTEYSGWAENKLIEGVKEARAKLEPAKLGVGWGMAMANINRRARDEEGPTYLGLNPDGPADRQIGLLRLEKADGTLLGADCQLRHARHGSGGREQYHHRRRPGNCGGLRGGKAGSADALYQWGGRKSRAHLHGLPGYQE